jgi:hypothetical protein
MKVISSLLTAGLLASSLWLSTPTTSTAAPPDGVSAADQNVQLVAQQWRGWGGGWGWGRNYAPYYRGYYGYFGYPRYYGSYYWPRYNYGYYGGYSYPGTYYAPNYGSANCYYDYNSGTYVCYDPSYGWYRQY